MAEIKTKNVFVYLLESLKSGQRYIGQTSNLNERMRRHNAGYVRSTRNNAPWKLLAYIQVESRQETIKLEEKLKRMKNRERVYRYFKDHGVVLPH